MWCIKAKDIKIDFLATQFTYSLMQSILCWDDKLMNSISLYRNGSRGMIGC